MRKLLLVMLLLLSTTSPVQADLISGPDDSFLWNQFNSVTVVDSFALATSDFGVARLQLDPISGYFNPVDHLLLSNQPYRVKVVGGVALVSTTSDIVYLVDLTDPPGLGLVGEVDLGATVHDAVLVGTDLYLACGFDGLRHYTLSGYSTLDFVDSSLTPIHCIQVEYHEPYLIVLDDYNGLVRYDLETTGIGQIESGLLVPKRVGSFLFTNDNTVIMPVVTGNLYYSGAFGPSGGYLTGITEMDIHPDRMFVTDSFLVAVNFEDRLIEGWHTIPGPESHHWLMQISQEFQLGFSADIYRQQTAAHLLLVSRNYGLIGWQLSRYYYYEQPRQVYTRPGPIRALDFHRGRLATGGERNPLELYQIDSENQPVFDTALFGLNNVRVAAAGGDLLFAHFAGLNQISALEFTDTSIDVRSGLPTAGHSFRKLRYYDYEPNDTASMLLAVGQNYVDIISVSTAGSLARADIARTLDDVLDAIVVDSFLLVSTSGRQLYAFRIFSSFHVILWWSVSTTGELNHMVDTGPRGVPGGWTQPPIVLGFDGNQMYEIWLRDDGMPVLYTLDALPIEVTNSALGPEAIYTIGPQGVGILDLSYMIPRMDLFGGYSGHLIAFHDSVLAVSDGTAVHLYSFPEGLSAPADDMADELLAVSYLGPNYPNPFNPRTRIDFLLPEPAQVELYVYDLLGRRVTSLLEGQCPAGLHSVEWDGTDRYGRRVASGVYFYRLSTPGVTETRKMVLLK